MGETAKIAKEDYDYTFIPEHIGELRAIMPEREGVSVVCPCIEDLFWLHECRSRRYFPIRVSREDFGAEQVKEEDKKRYKSCRLFFTLSERYGVGIHNFLVYAKSEDGPEAVEGVYGIGVVSPDDETHVDTNLIRNLPGHVEEFVYLFDFGMRGGWHFIGPDIEFQDRFDFDFDDNGNYDVRNREEVAAQNVIDKAFGFNCMYLDDLEIDDLKKHLAEADGHGQMDHYRNLPKNTLAWSFYAVSLQNLFVKEVYHDNRDFPFWSIFDVNAHHYRRYSWDSPYEEDNTHTEVWYGHDNLEHEQSPINTGFYYRTEEWSGNTRYGSGEFTIDDGGDRSITSYRYSSDKIRMGFGGSGTSGNIVDIAKYYDVMLYLVLSTRYGNHVGENGHNENDFREKVMYKLFSADNGDFTINEYTGRIEIPVDRLVQLASGFAGTCTYTDSGYMSESHKTSSSVHLDGAYAMLVPHEDIRCERVDDSEILNNMTDLRKKEEEQGG